MMPSDHPTGFLTRLRRSAGLRRLKPLAKSALPVPVLRWVQRHRKVPFVPPVGKVNFGDLRRLTPISRQYGYDRGRPIDRYFIESFLERNAELVRGRVLEIGDSTYTRSFGGNRVTQSDVLHAYDVPEATIVGDIVDLGDVPANSFDCMIVTQTLHWIYDVRAALASIYRILKPGGVLLTTFPGLSQISDDDWRSSWHWGFTTHSAERLFTEVFPASHVEVRARGNVLVTAAFLFGLGDTELTRDELEHDDPDYQMLITVKATKPGEDERRPKQGRTDEAQEPIVSEYGSEHIFNVQRP